MYFVVYNLRSREYRILPREWVHEVEKHFCKFLKNSINRGQEFWCFYTTNEEAFELVGNLKIPKGSYKPNFQLTRSSTNGDECFLAKFEDVKGKIKYSSQLAYHFNSSD